MDPVACIEELKIAVKEQNTKRVNSSLNDLWDWLEKGGCAPALVGPIFGFHDRGDTPWSRLPLPIKAVFEIIDLADGDSPSWITMTIDPILTTDTNDPSSFVWVINKWTDYPNYKEYKFPKP